MLLVAASALCHVTWNTIIKQTGRMDEMMGLSYALIAAFALVPFVIVMRIIGWDALPWGVLLGAGFFIGVYTRSLSAAYRLGDLTIIYPLARSAPIYVTIAAWIFLGEKTSPLGLVGIILAVLGCALLPLRHGFLRKKNFAWNHVLNVATLLAVFTALCTTGYSILDRVGMSGERFREFPVLGAFAYVYAEFTIGLFFYTLTFFPWRRSPRALKITARRHPKACITVAACNLAGYFLVLLALQTAKAAYVVAFRQMSVALSVPAGLVFLRETENWRYRTAGALTITAGLILIGLA